MPAKYSSYVSFAVIDMEISLHQILIQISLNEILRYFLWAWFISLITQFGQLTKVDLGTGLEEEDTRGQYSHQ